MSEEGDEQNHSAFTELQGQRGTSGGRLRTGEMWEERILHNEWTQKKNTARSFGLIYEK